MIVLDTHAWIWWTSEPAKLGAKGRREIAAASRIGVAAISTWEIAMLVKAGRLAFKQDPLEWIELALAQPRVELLPLTPAIAVRSAVLGPDFHGDSADRLIAATALQHHAALATKDRRIRDSKDVRCIW